MKIFVWRHLCKTLICVTSWLTLFRIGSTTSSSFPWVVIDSNCSTNREFSVHSSGNLKKKKVRLKITENNWIFVARAEIHQTLLLVLPSFVLNYLDEWMNEWIVFSMYTILIDNSLNDKTVHILSNWYHLLIVIQSLAKLVSQVSND